MVQGRVGEKEEVEWQKSGFSRLIRFYGHSKAIWGLSSDFFFMGTGLT
jgi:hypothetical protein